MAGFEPATSGLRTIILVYGPEWAKSEKESFPASYLTAPHRSENRLRAAAGLEPATLGAKSNNPVLRLDESNKRRIGKTMLYQLSYAAQKGEVG